MGGWEGTPRPLSWHGLPAEATGSLASSSRLTLSLELSFLPRRGSPASSFTASLLWNADFPLPDSERNTTFHGSFSWKQFQALLGCGARQEASGSSGTA